MADLRARLAEVLQEHRSMSGYGGGVICTARGCTWKWSPSGSIEQHQTDVLLSLPGIAIVELPEPTGSEPATEDENGFVEWEYPQGVVQVFDGGVIGWGRWHFEDATKLREAASALLAAANAAEEQKNER